MANLKSAIKRIRQNRTRRERNHQQKARLNTEIKKIRAAIQKGAKAQAQSALQLTLPLLSRAGQKRLIHPNAASRRISRLTAQIYALK